MKNIFAFLHTPQEESLVGRLPWEVAPSIWASLLAAVEDDVLQVEAMEPLRLPCSTQSTVEVTRTPGSSDGLLCYHEDAEAEFELVDEIADQLEVIAAEDSLQAKVRVYELVADSQVLVWIDELMVELEDRALKSNRSLKRFLRFLARRSPDVEPIKFALALLGVLGEKEDLKLLRVFGQHDEFTLFAAVGLCSLLEDAEWELFALAKKVRGWGRVHIVEMLAETWEPEIQHWLLCEGFRNSIRTEYLALTCALAGDLRSALCRPYVEEDVFEAAGELLVSMIRGGSLVGIEEYPDASRVILRYLILLQKRASRLRHFVLAEALRDYLETPLETTEEGQQQGWSVIRRATCYQAALAVLQMPIWERLIVQALGEGSSVGRAEALEVAGLLELDWLLEKAVTAPVFESEHQVIPFFLLERFWPRLPEERTAEENALLPLL